MKYIVLKEHVHNLRFYFGVVTEIPPFFRRWVLVWEWHQPEAIHEDILPNSLGSLAAESLFGTEVKPAVHA